MSNPIMRPLKSLAEKISKIKSLELSSVTIEEIRDELSFLLPGFSQVTPLVPSGQEVYRGIVYDDKPNELSFLSYAPERHAKANRASRENQCMFYGATSENVPFFELGVKPGEKLVISKWKTTRSIFMNNLGYTDTVFARL